jgi:hypothetical protein
MEDMENKLIASKLGELDTLPEGYKPNLDSKWELIEASMEGERKNRFLIYRAAAIITGIILLGYLFMPHLSVRPSAQIKEQQKTEPVTKHNKTLPSSEQNNKMVAVTVQPQTTVKVEKAKTKNNVIEMEPVQPETKIDLVSVTQNSVPLVASTTDTPNKKKKNRYVQLDFDDPVKEEITGVPTQQHYAKGFRIDLFNANAPPQTTYTNSSTALFKIKF